MRLLIMESVACKQLSYITDFMSYLELILEKLDFTKQRDVGCVENLTDNANDFYNNIAY